MSGNAVRECIVYSRVAGCWAVCGKTLDGEMVTLSSVRVLFAARYRKERKIRCCNSPTGLSTVFAHPTEMPLAANSRRRPHCCPWELFCWASATPVIRRVIVLLKLLKTVVDLQNARRCCCQDVPSTAGMMAPKVGTQTLLSCGYSANNTYCGSGAVKVGRRVSTGALASCHTAERLGRGQTSENSARVKLILLNETIQSTTQHEDAVLTAALPQLLHA